VLDYGYMRRFGGQQQGINAMVATLSIVNQIYHAQFGLKVEVVSMTLLTSVPTADNLNNAPTPNQSDRSCKATTGNQLDALKAWNVANNAKLAGVFHMFTDW
jgi:hypothetical protein